MSELSLGCAECTEKLKECDRGQYIIHRIDLVGNDLIRLQRLGICEGRKVEVLNVGNPLLIRVDDTRVGLSLRFAEQILVSHESLLQAT